MKRILILLACAGLAGCYPHSKDLDSYNTMFRKASPPGKGDPYAFGGLAESSGGTVDRVSYATDNQSPDPRDATETGQLGEIGKDRSHTPGGLPGETGTLPGTGTAPAAGAPATSAPKPTPPAAPAPKPTTTGV